MLQGEKIRVYKIIYTNRLGVNNTILVKAVDERQALINAKTLCATGKDFRDPVETEEKYNKPRKQGFYGFN